MQDHLKTTRGNHISIGMFVFVIAAVCVTAIFGTGITFGAGDHSQSFAPEPPAAQLADALVDLDLDPELGDATLRQVTQAVMDRAAAGDVEAAAFVLALAARQRADRVREDQAATSSSSH